MTLVLSHDAKQFITDVLDEAERRWDRSPEGIQERIGGRPARGDLYVYRVKSYSNDVVAELVDTAARSEWVMPTVATFSPADDLDPVAHNSTLGRRFRPTTAQGVWTVARYLVPLELRQFGSWDVLTLSLCRMAEVTA